MGDLFDSKAEGSGEPLLNKENEEKEEEIVIAEDLQMTKKKKMVEKLQNHVSNQETVQLLGMWIKTTLPFYFEMIFLVGGLFYVDVILDAQTLWIFYSQGSYRYCGVNTLAIIIANFYSLIDMLKEVPSYEPGWLILLIGYLTPLFGHIGVLVFISLINHKKHPLLACAKLAEAAIEAFTSALVQTYALIQNRWDIEDPALMLQWFMEKFSPQRHLHKQVKAIHDKSPSKGSSALSNQFFTISWSVATSFLSIGYAFMCFDRQDIGFLGVPGKLHGLSVPMILVFFVRTAEVASRVCTVAIFSRITKNIMDHGDDPVDPHSSTIVHIAMFFKRNFLMVGGPPLLVLDVLIIGCLILYYQPNNRAQVVYAMPSALSFMNPMLEKGNPCTIPAHVYYCIRIVEMLLMFILAEEFAGHEKVLGNDLHKEEHRTYHYQYMYIEQAAIIATVVWLILFPIVRYFFASHVLFSYTTSMFGDKRFNKGQMNLRDELLDSEEVIDRKRANGTKSLQLVAVATPSSSTLEPPESSREGEAPPNKSGGEAMKVQEKMTAIIKRVLDGAIADLNKAMNKKTKKGDDEKKREAEERQKTIDKIKEMKKKKKLQKAELKKKAEAAAADPSAASAGGAEEGVKKPEDEKEIALKKRTQAEQFLYTWAEGVIQEHEASEQRRGATDELFRRLLTLSANLVPHTTQREPTYKWVSSVGKLQHRNALQCLREAMRDTGAQQIAVDVLPTLLSVLPTWSQWDQENDEDHEEDRKLHEEKWKILTTVGMRGWSSQYWHFYRQAVQLHQTLDIRISPPEGAQPSGESKESGDIYRPEGMSDTHWEECAKLQARTLANLYNCLDQLGPDTRMVHSVELRKLFRPEIEWKAMIEGCTILLKQPGVQVWSDNDLLHFCNAGTRALEIDREALGKNEHDFKDIRDHVEQAAKKHVDEVNMPLKQSLTKIPPEENRQVREKLKTLEADVNKILLREQYEFAPSLRTHCKKILKTAQDDTIKHEVAEKSRLEKDKVEAEKKRKIEEQKRKEEERKRKEEEAQRKSAEEDRDEIEQMLNQAHDDQLRRERAARKALRDEKIKRRDLRQKMKRVQTQNSNGVVVTCKVKQDIMGFFDYIRDEDDDDDEPGTNFRQCVAEWLNFPFETMTMEDSVTVQGAIRASIKMGNDPKANKAMDMLRECKSGQKKLKKTSDGLTVTITEVKDSKTFTVSLAGSVGDFLLYDENKQNFTEELETQLGLSLNVLEKPKIVSVTGELSVHLFISVTKFVRNAIQSGTTSQGALELPGYTCIMSVEHHDVDVGDDDESVGISEALGATGKRPTPKRPGNRGLAAVAEDSDSDYSDSD